MKTTYKSILVIAILFLSVIAINTGYANNPAAEKPPVSKNMQELMPYTPSEADFNEDNINQTIDLSALAPTTPAEADFCDSL